MVLLASISASGQRQSLPPDTTGFDDVVFDLSLSPDGQTLAIARGAAEPAQRFGRIELWDTNSGKLRRIIKGFDGPVKSISYSPDGQTILSGSLEFRSDKIQQKARSRDGVVYGELKWWDNATGELKRNVRLPGEGNANLAVVISPDGKDVVVAESFIAWSFLQTGPIQPPLFGAPGFPVQQPNITMRPLMFFNSDTKVFSAETGELKYKLNDDHWGAVDYSPDGSLIAVTNSGGVRLWNTQTGKEEHKLKGFKGRPNAFAFSPDGKTLAVASMTFDREVSRDFIKIIGSSQIKLFDVRTWREIRKVTDIGAVNSISFSPNGKLLLMGGVMKQGEKEVPGVNVLHLESGQLANFPMGDNFKEAVDSLSISKDGSLVAFRSGPVAVKVLDGRDYSIKNSWDANSVGDVIERPTSRFLVSVKRVLAVAFSPDGTTVSASTDQGEIKFWDSRTGEVKGQLEKGDEDPAQAAASSDGRAFAQMGEGNKLVYWSMGSSGKQTFTLPSTSEITAIALSADGRSIAVGSGATVSLLDANGSVLKTIPSNHGPVNKLAFSPTGRNLAGVTAEGAIDIWNVADGHVESSLGGNEEITAIQFSPDGHTLATAGASRAVTLWNILTRQAEKKLDKHDATINALAFSSDGELLASGSDDRTVVIWDVASGKSRRTFKGHDQTVGAVAFSPDGKFIASGTGNASVVLWEVRTGKFSRVLR